MTTDDYKTLSERDRLFCDILLDIAAGIRALRQDISRDIEETLKS
jgi:hypothetical protein